MDELHNNNSSYFSSSLNGHQEKHNLLLLYLVTHTPTHTRCCYNMYFRLTCNANVNYDVVVVFM